MNNLIYIILFAFLGICIIIINNKLNKVKRISTIFGGISFFYLLYFCIIPILLFAFESEFTNYSISFKRNIYDRDFFSIIFGWFLIVVSYFFFVLGYLKNHKRNRQMYNLNIDRFKILSSRIAYISLLLGGISLLLYIISFGGLQRTLTNSEYVRSFFGSADDLTSFNSGFLLLPSLLVTICPFLFYYLLDNCMIKTKSYYKYLILFVISFVLAIIYFLINAGRMELLFFILCYIYPFIRNISKYPWIVIVIIAIFCLPLLDILDNLSLFFQSGEFGQLEINYIKYLSQFTYPIKNIFNITSITYKYGFRLGYDLILCPFNIIPGIFFKPSYELISAYFSGINWAYVGGTPTDFITFSYLQFGLISVTILNFCFGHFCFSLDKVIKTFKSIKKNSVYVLCSYVMIGCYMIMLDGDVSTLVRGKFVFLILFFIFIYSTKNGIKVKGRR